jgi:Sulfatase
MNLKTIAQGYAAAILLLLLRVWPHISPHHAVLYHSFLPMQSMIWGVFIDLMVLALSAALLFSYLERSEGGRRNAAWALVAAVVVPALAADVAAVWQKSLPSLYGELLFYGTLLLALALRWLRPTVYQQAVRGSRFLLMMAGLSLVWMAPELLYLAFRAQPADSELPVLRAGPPSVAMPKDGRRIIWLLFDELSYNQVFEHRFPGLSMPVFDKLKSESVLFTNLQPVGDTTERVVPSFFLGQVVNRLRSDLDGRPSVKFAGQSGWQPFDAHATLFADAQQLGWTTGVVGWHNPYCRILAGTLNYCFWRMGDGQWNGTAPSYSAFKNAMAPVMEVVRGWKHSSDHPQEEKHAADLAALMPQAEALIRDQSINFVFIHLSVPHPPGIYDRRSPHPGATGTYIDNLALADRTLGELMETLNATPAAAKTTLIVCSDHSWRIALWHPTGQWSREEETASEGRFDPRPVLMIHQPGQQAEHDVNQPFDEIRIHDIIEHLLRGQEPGFAKALLAGDGALHVAAQP